MPLATEILGKHSIGSWIRCSQTRYGETLKSMSIKSWSGRFLDNRADKCYPYFELLKFANHNIKMDSWVWAWLFASKNIVGKFLTLWPLFLGEPLTLYVASSDTTVSAILVSELGAAQCLVYYFYRALQGVEVRYPPLKKLALADVVWDRRLCPYFQAHALILSTIQKLH